jgi:hypothetical protein
MTEAAFEEAISSIDNVNEENYKVNNKILN